MTLSSSLLVCKFYSLLVILLSVAIVAPQNKKLNQITIIITGFNV
jgi:hypothetical protein